MIPKECKRLAEVDFPIAEVSRHAAREKSIRHGDPSTLHLWWARRPLASSRAVLMALLLPDPCDPQCPDEFKGKARETLLVMRGRASGWDSTVKTDEGLRRVLLRFIADFANWDNSAKAEQLLAPKPKEAEPEPERDETPVPTPDPAPTPPGGQQATPMPQKVTLQIRGTVPYESWNTLGTRILPKIRSGEALNLSVDLSVQVDAGDFNYAGVGAQACGLGIQDRKVLGHPILSHLNSRPAIAAATMLFKRDHTVSATRYAAQVCFSGAMTDEQTETANSVCLWGYGSWAMSCRDFYSAWNNSTTSPLIWMTSSFPYI